MDETKNEVGKKLLKGVPVSGIANEHDWAEGGFYLNENPNSVSMEVDRNVKLKPELLVPTSGSQLFHAAPYVQLQVKKYKLQQSNKTIPAELLHVRDVKEKGRLWIQSNLSEVDRLLK